MLHSLQHTLLKVSVLLFLFVLPYSVSAQIDSAALVIFYEDTQGDSWDNSTNWLDTMEQIGDWYGIDSDYSHDFVRAIHLRNNNLGGTLGSSLIGMLQLITLDLSDNNIGGELPFDLFLLPDIEHISLDNNNISGVLPNTVLSAVKLSALLLRNNALTSVPPGMTGLFALDSLDISENHLTFKDVIPLVDEFPYFRYAPQKNVGTEELVFVTRGETFSVNGIVADLGSEYQWFKDGVEIPGATSLIFEIPAVEFSDQGFYHCEITHPEAPDLTIIRETVRLVVENTAERQQDSLALALLYQASGGEDWTRQDSWMLGTINNWFGVIMRNNRVVELRLPSNNLIGTLPSEIGNLDSLNILDLSGNQLFGTVPHGVANCRELIELDLSRNKLSGQFPISLNLLSKLHRLDLEANNFSGNFPNISGMDSLRTLNLSDNSLESILDANLDLLDSVQNIDLSGNNLTDLPDLTGLPKLAFLQVQDNKLVFAPIEPNKEIFMDYAPQQKIDEEEVLTLSEKTSYTFRVSLDSSFYNYQWRKNGNPIAGANSAAFTLSNLDEEDEGSYSCIINYDSLPDLQLFRNDILVSVNTASERLADSLALVALYESTNGDEWTNNTNWLSRPMDTWFGITIENGRVTDVQLRENNLSGRLPDEIGDLSGARIFNLSANPLEGLIPNSIGDMSNLRHLDLSETRPEGEITDENIGLRGNVPSGINGLGELEILNLSRAKFFENLDIASLHKLQEVYVSDNNFTEIRLSATAPIEIFEADINRLEVLPDMTSASDLRRIRVENNRLTFEDLEPYADVPSFSYSPQGFTGLPESLIIKPGELFRFSVSVGGSANAYEWQQDGVSLPSGTAPVVGKDAALRTDQGIYKCFVTNPLLPDLTVESQDKYLFVVTPDDILKDSLALVFMYNAMGGRSWENQWNWLSPDAPISDWHGIKLNGGGRVKEINLPGNLLLGGLPAEMKDLRALEKLDLRDNNIILTNVVTQFPILKELDVKDCDLAEIPDMSNLINLERLDVSRNRLDFTDLAPNVVHEPVMTYSPQDSLGTGDLLYVELETPFEFEVEKGTDDDEYQWYQNGALIEGAENRGFSRSRADDTDYGSYLCRVRNSFFPELTLWHRAFDVFVPRVTSIEEERYLENITFFPNPADVHLNIRLPESGRFTSLKVFDMKGSLIYEGITKQDMKLDVSNWSSGVYMFRLKTGEETFTQKVMIQR